jgi:alanine dehydrogenase
LRRQVTAIGYETVQMEDGRLPLLTPMSEVAGRMAVYEGAKYLESARGGKGILLSGARGFARNGRHPRGGVAGLNAAKVACGLGARVTILDISLQRLRFLDDTLDNVTTLIYTPMALEEILPSTDVLIGAVLVPGAKAPKLVTRAMLKRMQKGSVIVDVCIDQGGCMETSRPTTHSDPTYIVDGIVHYCVANMPGAVAHTLHLRPHQRYVSLRTEPGTSGILQSHRRRSALARGVNTYAGKLTDRAVAEALKREYTPLEDVT